MTSKLTFRFGFLCLLFASQCPIAAQRIKKESKTDGSYETLVGAGASQKWKLSGPASKSRQSIQLSGNGASAVLLRQLFESFELQLEAKTSRKPVFLTQTHAKPL